MAKIGIGCTTYNRDGMIKEWKVRTFCESIDWEYFYQTTGTKNQFDGIDKKGNLIYAYIAEDTDEDRRGISYRKNECLRALKDCDYIFLFDDDTFPIKEGWIDYFINNSGGCHLLYLNESHNKQHSLMDVDVYSNCGGAFMFMTSKHIKKVGAFNEKFGLYGFEHAEYSMRINGARRFYCLNRTQEYIYAHDYSTPNHKSSITDEEKQKHIKESWNKFFNEPIKQIHIPL